MSEKLKPCPACGGEAKLLCLNHTRVQCQKCRMSGPYFRVGDDFGENSRACEKNAITSWNSLPRFLTWGTEPPMAAGTYGVILKDKTVTMEHYFVPPDEESVREIAAVYWLGPLPHVFSILCEMDEEARP